MVNISMNNILYKILFYFCADKLNINRKNIYNGIGHD